MIDSTRAFAKLVAAFNQNDWPRVQQRSKQLLAAAPDDARVHFMAGVASMQTQQLPKALEQLQKAARLEPRRADYAAQYAKALSLSQRKREARLAADRAMTLSPDDALTLDTLGVLYAQANAPVQSATAFRRAAALAPEHAPAHFSLAYALSALGDDDGAERALETCIRLQPRHWRAHLNLVHLRTQTAERNPMPRMRELLERHGSDPGAQLLLNLALGKACDDLADYPRAFEHYARGKTAGRRMWPHESARDETMFDALIRAFPAAAGDAAAGDPSRAPVFIVGMPCMGTRLLERILAGHPAVRSVGEAQNFPRLLQQASGGSRPLLAEADIAACMRHVDWRRLGADYLADMPPASDDATRFVDALPLNFLHVGFIARALPNARIVCPRRHPLDTCLDIFRRLFEPRPGGYEYSFDLNDIGRYYIQFDRLMAHWRKLLPGRILELPCEALADSPEAAVRDLLAFCGLPWHDDCLRPLDKAAAASTPNARQAREPGQLSATGHWRHYETQLRDLRWLLAGAGIGAAD